MNGFTEVLTWILCSNRENFALLNREDDRSSAVIIGNPRSSDFEVCVKLSLVVFQAYYIFMFYFDFGRFNLFELAFLHLCITFLPDMHLCFSLFYC